ncbi:MAG: hypothetical protein HOP33_13770 [Verrucomicrobia bacterium]|nr:hypothetical protein [Verrucomicrobiota bacterium]
MKRYTSLLAVSLMLAALLPSLMQAQPISLPSAWGQYDLQEQQGFSAGLLSLAAESSSGFTATVGSNGIALGPDYPAYTGYPSKSQYLPRVYTFFAGQPITTNGQRVTFSFDVKFNNLADPGNNGSFRFTMGDTNCNNSWGEFLGIGTASSSTFRYDGTITQDTNWIDTISGNSLYMPPDLSNPNNPTNYSFGSLCDFNGSSVGGGGVPNGVKMGVDTTTVHHIRFSVERTPSGLQVDSVWNNSAGTAVEHAAFAPVPGGAGDDHSGLPNVSPWTNVNIFGFCLFGTGANEHFFGYDPGSFTVSNLKAYSGFNITAFQRDPASGDVTLTWESTKVDVCEYVVLKSTDLSSWTSISTNITEGFQTSYTNSATADNAAYYRVEKVYP